MAKAEYDPITLVWSTWSTPDLRESQKQPLKTDDPDNVFVFFDVDYLIDSSACMHACITVTPR